jgi:phage recombination protein Bet
MTTALTTTNGQTFSAEYVALIQRHVMQSVDRPPSPEEFQMFLATCQRTGLDPIMRQIYCIERRQQKNNQWISKYETQISIDGARLVAERTTRYEGQVGPLWCGEDAVWYDVWPFPTAPIAAKVGIWKTGFREPLWAVAHYGEYVQTDRNGNPTRFWKQMPALMLAKCAEALALRKAFPNDLSGLYTREEMAQAENPEGPPQVVTITPDAPQLPAPEQSTPTMRTPDAPATDKQLGMLAALRDELGWTKAQAIAFMRDKGMDLTVLTKGQASTLIEAFQHEIKLYKEEATKQPPLSSEYDDIDTAVNGAIAGVAK